jgi:uncharacterized protein GlcG (DUF336 family)
MRFALMALSCLSFGTLAARANEPHGAPLPLTVLLDAAHSAVAACEKHGYKITVTVLDADISTRLVLRADGAHDDTVEFGYRKAYTAAKAGMSSRDFGKTIPNSAQLDPKPGSGPPAAPGPVNGDPHLITWPGGFPIMVDGRLVGAISAAGAPGGEKDEVCVKAGLARVPGIDQ